MSAFRKMFAGAVCAGLLAVAPAASAAVIADFEDGTTTGWTIGGTVGAVSVSSDYAYNGTKSLYLGNGGNAYMTIPAEYIGVDGVVITMRVLDLGKWLEAASGNNYGAKWGISNGTGDGNFYGAGLQNAASMGSGAGYTYNNDTTSRFGTWFTPHYYGPSRAVLADNPGGEIAANPVWTTWTFTITNAASGVATMQRTGAAAINNSGNNMGGPVDQVWAHGGRAGATYLPLSDVYVDYITIVPEPGTFAAGLISVLGLGLRRRAAKKA